MEPILAFVGHSFRKDDAAVVEAILAILKRVADLHPSFSWVHAQEPEPTGVDEKVLRLFAGCNLFIGICTAAELVVAAEHVKKGFGTSRLSANESDFASKTSDWILQEIGIAIGKGIDIILLLENGVRPPGAALGNLEYVPFVRSAPSECFDKLLGMISALRPPEATARGASSSEANSTGAAARAQKSEATDTPRPSAAENLEFEMFDAIMKGDEERIKLIDTQFRASPAAREDLRLRKWSAELEYWRILLGRGGSASELRRLAETSPEIGPVWSDLALVYESFDDWHSAALAHERAAHTHANKRFRATELGQAAIAHMKSADPQTARRVTAEMYELRNDPESDERDFLRFEVNRAEFTTNDALYIAAVERLLQLDPTDNDRRFNLAYKYSNMGMNETALLHYRAIPNPARTAMAWNNLGVERAILKLPVRAVAAYRKSEELGETLAMSNLAEKLMRAGFLPEARKLLDSAL
jgi:tetratricopeptide (TPR) repeat protein